MADLLGRPLLSWTLQSLWAVNPAEIVVACRSEERAAIRAACAAMEDAPSFQFVEAGWQTRAGDKFPVVLAEGGATRQDSVWAAVRASRGDWIVVHDAARPCTSRALMEATLDAAKISGAAIAALPSSDTVKRAAPDGSIDQTLERSEIWLAQTPQIFRREPFLAALEEAACANWQGTDCASILERAGHRVTLVAGESDNLKVTYAPDLERAATILARR